MFLDRLFLSEFDDDQIWSAFHRLRGYAAPPFDASEGHAHVADGLRLLAYEDWAALEELYGSQTADQRHHWLDGMGALHPMDKALPKVPDTAFGYAIAGGVLVGKAWRARGFGSTHLITDERAAAYTRILEDARWALGRAERKDGLDVVITSYQIRCGLGLGMDRDTIFAFEDRLLAAREPSLLADNTMLQCYARKWYGSHDAMWDWAQGRCNEESARNPSWLALLARAEIEHWMYECHLSPDEAARDTYLATTRTSAFRDQSLDLQSRFLDSLARHRDPSDTAQLHYAHNAFGTYFHLFGPKEGLAPHLEAIGSTPALIPWIHTGIEDDSLAFLNSIRRKAGLKPFLEKISDG